EPSALSLHDALPIWHGRLGAREGGDLHRQQRHEPHAVPLDDPVGTALRAVRRLRAVRLSPAVLALLYSPVPARGTEPKWRNWQRSEEHTSELQSREK